MNVSGLPPRSITFHVAFSDKLSPKTWGLWGQRYSNRRHRQTFVCVLIKRDVQTTPAASDADSQGGWLPLPLPLKQIVLKIWHDMLSDSARRWRNMFTRCVNPIISQHYLLFPSDTKKYISNSVCIVLFFFCRVFISVNIEQPQFSEELFKDICKRDTISPVFRV